MISGKYSFYLDGEQVCQSKNIITDVGLDAIRKFLVGDYPNWAEALAVGTGSTSAASNNTRLEFEVDREPVFLKTMVTPRHYISQIVVTGGNTATCTLLEYPKFDNGDTITISGTTIGGSTQLNGTYTASSVNVSAKTFVVTKSGITNGTYSQESYSEPYVQGEDVIILKARFSDELAMRIKEVGVFSRYETRYDSGYNTGIISDFSESGWGSFGSSTSLVNSSNVTCTTTAKTLTGMSFSMDPYTTSDRLYLLVYNPTNTSKTVTVTLYSGSTSKAFVFDVSSTVGVQVVYKDIDSLPLSTVTSMTIQSSASIDLDALSVENYDQFGASDLLVSRSVLPSTIVKTSGQQLEIEYALRIV